MTWIADSIVLILLAIGGQALAQEKIALIVSKNSPIQKLSPDQIKNLFLGQTRFAEEGKAVSIADRERDSAIYKEFYAMVANMSPKEVGVNWARKVFTGEAPAPTRLKGDDNAAKEWVRTRDEGLTYVYAKNCDAKVRVVALLESVPGR